MRHKIPAFPFNFMFQYFINTLLLSVDSLFTKFATANPFEIFPPKSFLTQHERDVCLLPGVVLIHIRSKESLNPKKATKKPNPKTPTINLELFIGAVTLIFGSWAGVE